jgi:hypothetical protein
MLPAAAVPLRVCFIGAHLAITEEHTSCCHECDKPDDSPQPCCVDLEALPDALTPETPFIMPALPICILPDGPTVAPILNYPVGDSLWRSLPIRGPDSPGVHRALFGVWRL